MNQVKIDIGQYREVNKGSFKATFSIVIYPKGQKILDCRYFVNGENRWFNFPQKEIKYTDGRKTEYIPLISYFDKDYQEQLKAAVLTALKDAEQKEKNGQAHIQSTQKQTDSLSSQSPTDWETPPF